MFDLQKMKAENKDDMNQQLIEMDVAGAQDQAARAAQADEQVGTLQAGAASAFIGGVTSAAEAQALYPKKNMDGLNKSQVFKNNPTSTSVNNTPLALNNAGNYQEPMLASAANPNLNMYNTNPGMFFWNYRFRLWVFF